MTTSELAVSTNRDDMIDEMNLHIEKLFESNMTKFSSGESAQEIAKDYPDELLEALLMIFRDGDPYNPMEIVDCINMPRYEHMMLATAKVHQQLTKSDFLPGCSIGFRRTMRYVQSLQSYKLDDRVPAVPESGYPLHPIHLGIIVVTEALYMLLETTEFNGVDEGMIEWLEATSYKLISDELLNYISTHPENGARVAQVGYLLETMRLDELLPYVGIMERSPDTEKQITGLLSNGTTRLTQVEAILSGEIKAPLSEGTL